MTGPEQDVIKIHTEINTTNIIMLAGVLLGVIMMFVCFVCGLITGNKIFYMMMFLLLDSIGFWVTRGDYLIHRYVPYILMVDEAKKSPDPEAALAQLPSSEEFKEGLKSPKLMIVFDLLAGLAFILMVAYGGIVLWDNEWSRAFIVALTEHTRTFVIVCIIAFAVSILSTVGAVKLAHAGW